MSKVDTIQEKILPPIMKFANSKIITAIKDGVIITMPLTLVGSIFLLIANFPIKSWGGWMTGIFGPNWAVPLSQVSGSTFDIMAIAAVIGIAAQYAKNEGQDPVTSGLLGAVAFLIVMPSYSPINIGDKVGGVVMKHADKVSAVIPKGWTGGKGMIAAIIIGVLTGFIYSWFLKRDIRIKLPESVPSGVANAFSALIPGAVIITGAMCIFIFFNVVTGQTALEWIYKVLQIPLQGITDSLGGAIAIPFVISFFWFFGVHGATLIGGVMGSIYQANTLANQDVFKAGHALVASGAGKNAHIVCQQFQDNFITLGGSGITLGLVAACFLFARSQRLKQLGRLALVPGCFNINEPVLFGLPIVLNPLMFIPFLICPLVSGILTYFAIYTGLVPCFTAVQAIWTTPPILSGLIVAGWRGAVLQLIIIAIAAIVYFPFFKALDKEYFQEEISGEAEE
ncbi:PTS sugar transporter subunit IIC [Clostridium felsineum]|uniref:PTS sugar transporter subunit IIC n=1 Tax=Clostridium felsineum TaxID=36839 RepID=UPI00098C8E31|nr:PTS sugar transporter subunit IIC [Clostridium felsineum]MCR3761534.1 PTS sugar transporter subunit IIC [Clostridium felsineum]URZ02318.1 Lichenan permease IIC component [Clostridium felsineum]